MRHTGDADELNGVTLGAVTSKSPSLLLIKTKAGVFRLRINRADNGSAGVKKLRDDLVVLINRNPALLRGDQI